MYKYILILGLLIICELAYFKLADRYNIIDKPNARSSHSKIVIRGGGVIFLLGVWIWGVFYDFQYPWFLFGLTLIAGISFIDDIHSLPDSVRLVIQFVAMGLMFYQLDILHWSMWWIVIMAFVICVGASNIYNFMDGINGITPAYSLAILIPLFLMNREILFVEESIIVVIILSALVFSFFNFRPKNMAKCFAGDVGSIGMSYVLLFLTGCLIMWTKDVTWLILFVVYGVDGVCTICHRILLHENLGEAHRKHCYQIMSNELHMGHVTVSVIYMVLQLGISSVMIYLIPDTKFAHWVYLFSVVVVLVVSYCLFMNRYYCLHEEYLASLNGDDTKRSS